MPALLLGNLGGPRDLLFLPVLAREVVIVHRASEAGTVNRERVLKTDERQSGAREQPMEQHCFSLARSTGTETAFHVCSPGPGGSSSATQ